MLPQCQWLQQVSLVAESVAEYRGIQQTALEGTTLQLLSITPTAGLT